MNTHSTLWRTAIERHGPRARHRAAATDLRTVRDTREPHTALRRGTHPGLAEPLFRRAESVGTLRSMMQ